MIITTKYIFFPLFIFFAASQCFCQRVFIKVEKRHIVFPIDDSIVSKSVMLLNTVFNLPAFEDSLSHSSFVCTNKAGSCDSVREISGSSVYKDLMRYDTITINLRVKKLWNPWKRRISGTLGETPPEGNTITTYTWWLDNSNIKNLTIAYATHIGHEIFHTKYFKYIHDPKINSKEFVEDKDVTYKVDNFLEALIQDNYK